MPEITHDDAFRALRAEYYTAVKSYAEDLKDRITRKEIKNHDELIQAVEEDVDGSEWVIYTRKAQQVLFVSDNEDAYVDELGTDGVVKDGAINWNALAYMAMRTDLQETLETIGIDHKYKFGADDESDEDDEEEA